MEFNEATYDRIYKHLHNQLANADKEDFELMMAQNPDLVSEIEKHKNAESMVLDAYLLGVRSQTQQLIQQKKSQATLKKWIGGGSMLFMITAGVTMYLYSKQEHSNVEAQLPINSTTKKSSIVINTLPNPTLETPKLKPTTHKVVSSMPKDTNLKLAPSPSVDLDKEAQLLYLRQLEQQHRVESAKAKDLEHEPKPQAPISKENTSESKQAVSAEEQSKPVYIAPQEILFDLVYEPKLGSTLEIPTGGLTEGKFKIIDEAGITVYEAGFENQEKPIWNGQFKNSTLNHNKQLNVLIFNNKNQVHGLGKISVVY